MTAPRISPFPPGSVLDPDQGGTGLDLDGQAANQLLVTDGAGSYALSATLPALPLGAATANSLAIVGTAGAGYETFVTQTVTPATPPLGSVKLYASTALSTVARLTMLTSSGAVLAFFRDVVNTMRNISGAPIAKGSLVYITGSNGSAPTIDLAQANALNFSRVIGIAIAQINNNAYGTVQKVGIFTGVNTSGFSNGDALWLSSAVAGALTNVQPTTANLSVRVGTVVTSAVNGTIDLSIQNTIVDTDTALTNNSDAVVCSQKAIKAYIAQMVSGLLDFKGNIDASTNPNYPAGLKGDTYIISVAGKIGGAAGLAVDIGDTVVCSIDNAGGTQAAVGADWFILEHNLQGALLSANNLTDVANTATSLSNIGGIGAATTNTLTNKAITPRVLSAANYVTNTGASLNADTTDIFIVSAQAGALKFNNPSGTPVDGQILWLSVTGTAARAITFDTLYEASTVALPTTTVTTARLDMVFMWCATTSAGATNKWRLMGVA